MTDTRRASTRLAVLLSLTALALAGLAAPQVGAKKASKGAPVGVWSGTATYTSPPEADGEGGGIEYDSAIVITTSKRGGVVRVSGVIATVRTYCLAAVRDIRILKGDLKNGPKVSNGGSFTFKAQGATISGTLGRPFASGRIRASAAGCELADGVWEARKRRF